jgi:hypothetical protein
MRWILCRMGSYVLLGSVVMGLVSCDPGHIPVSTTTASGEAVAGMVMDAQQHPLEHVSIIPEAVRLDDPKVIFPLMAIYTAFDGHYSMSLPPGDYRIQAMADGYTTGVQQVRIQPGQPTIVNFVLKSDPKSGK